MNLKLLKDKYRLNKILDEDELFIVFEGEIVDRPDLDVEVHVLKNKWLKNSGLVQKITNEYQGQEKLSHPGILRIHDIDFFKNVYFIVKERATGHTLEALFDRKYAFSTLQAINIATQLTRALGYAHKEGLRLRSLTPADLLVTRDLKVKITRFRTPRSLEGGEGKAPGPPSDLFFLGSLLYEMLGRDLTTPGGRSFATDLKEASEIVFRLPEGAAPDPTLEALRSAIFRCLTRDPARRYTHYEELLKDLQGAVQTSVDETEVKNAMEMAAPGPADRRPARPEQAPGRQIAALAEAPEEILLAREAEEEPAPGGRAVDFGDGEAANPRLLVALGALAAFLGALAFYFFY